MPNEPSSVHGPLFICIGPISSLLYLFLPLLLLGLPPDWAPVVFALFRESVLLSSISKSSPAESVLGVRWASSESSASMVMPSVMSDAGCERPKMRPTVLRTIQMGMRTTAVSKNVGLGSSLTCHCIVSTAISFSA